MISKKKKKKKLISKIELIFKIKLKHENANHCTITVVNEYYNNHCR
jgi:hypothetical protein